MTDLVSERWNKFTDEEPKMYNVVLDQEEGFALKLGDRIAVPWDMTDDSGGEFFEGDEGVVIGFTFTAAGAMFPARQGVVVAFEGCDPQTMDDPDNIASLEIISSES